MPDTGLTAFILNMQKAPPAALQAALANPAPIAAKYGIKAEWAAWYIAMWLQ